MMNQENQVARGQQGAKGFCTPISNSFVCNIGNCMFYVVVSTISQSVFCVNSENGDLNSVVDPTH